MPKTATATPDATKTAKTATPKEVIVVPEAENLDVLEANWGEKKAELMYRIFEEAAHPVEGKEKKTRAGVAGETNTSLGFIQGLASYTVTFGRGKAKLANRKRDDVVKVLDALGITEEDFLKRLRG